MAPGGLPIPTLTNVTASGMVVQDNGQSVIITGGLTNDAGERWRKIGVAFAGNTASDGSFSFHNQFQYQGAEMPWSNSS